MLRHNHRPHISPLQRLSGLGTGFVPSVILLTATAIGFGRDGDGPQKTQVDRNEDPSAARSESAVEKLTGAELIAAYEEAGLSLRDSRPRASLPFDDPGFLRFGGWSSKEFQQFWMIRTEIVKRGSRMVPELIDFLREEATKPQSKDAGFTTDIVELLVAIRDAKAVPCLVEIVETGSARKANRAREGLERLTYCAFRRVERHRMYYDETVPHSVIVDTSNQRAVAAQYRTWLNGEGKDSTQWPILARKRAKKLLASDDLTSAYCAATFLRPYQYHNPTVLMGRDDQLQVSMNRIAEILAGYEKRDDGYVWQGSTAEVNVGAWLDRLSAYGPMARPHAGLFIRFQNEARPDHRSGFARLRNVGCEATVEYLIESLPKLQLLEAEARDSSLRECRNGIDRWTGRHFESDAKRLEWWNANKHRTMKQWLQEGLPIAAAQADAGTGLYSKWIFDELAPDYSPQKPTLTPRVAGLWPNIEPATVNPTSRVEWLKDHQSQLKYEPHIGAFRQDHRSTTEETQTPEANQYKMSVFKGLPRKGRVTKDEQPVFETLVTANKPFDCQAKEGLGASGVLREDEEGKLHFKGQINLSPMASFYDLPVELGQRYINRNGFSSGFSFSFFVLFEQVKDGDAKDDADVADPEPLILEARGGMNVTFEVMVSAGSDFEYAFDK